MDIKSFVLRQGKITRAQQDAVDQLYGLYGIDYTNQLVDLNQIFNRNNPKILEIGFGMGVSTLEVALNNPQNDYLGVEVHTPGVGTLLNGIHKHKVTNLKVLKHDVVDVLGHMIADNTITGFHIYFPDPWPKKRHHKRRLIKPSFVSLLIKKLIPNGYVHLATDWEEYATSMLQVLSSNSELYNSSKTNDYIERPESRPLTKFELRGLGLGHGVWDIMFIKKHHV